MCVCAKDVCGVGVCVCRCVCVGAKDVCVCVCVGSLEDSRVSSGQNQENHENG